MSCSNTCNTGCKETKKDCCNNQGGFAFILVLFILVILVGAAWAY